MRNGIFFFTVFCGASCVVLACSGAGAPLGTGDGGSSSSGSSGGSSGGGSGGSNSGGSSGGGSGGSSGSSSSSGGGSGGGSGSSSSSSGGGSGGSSGGSSGGGSGSSSGATCNPTPPDGGACNSLQVDGPLVPLACVPGPLPTPKGGTIADGTYVMTAATYYGATCPAPEGDRNKWLVCGTTWQTVQENNANGTTSDHWFDLNVTVSGTTLQLQGTCGFTQTISFPFDATPTTLTLYVGGSSTPGEGRVDVYTRQ